MTPISSNREPSISPPQVVTATAPVDRTFASNLPPVHTEDGTGQLMATERKDLRRYFFSPDTLELIIDCLILSLRMCRALEDVL